MMLTTNEVARIYDTILSIPGMNDTVKLDMRVSRKNILLLNSVIERGLSGKDAKNSSSILNSVPEETLQELKEFSGNCLIKAGLTELSEKLHFLKDEK